MNTKKTPVQALQAELRAAQDRIQKLEKKLAHLSKRNALDLEIPKDHAPLPDKQDSLEAELYRLVRKDSSIFNFFQKGSVDGVWYWDLENPDHEWMSPEFWLLLGYDPKNKKHSPSEWQDLIFQEDLETALNNFHKHCADPHHPYDQIVRYRHKNGSTVWVRCRGIAIRDASGKPVRMLGAHNDLTRQMQAEERWRFALDGARDGLWDWDVQADRFFYSTRWKNMLSLNSDHDGGSLENLLQRIHARDKDRVCEKLAGLLQGQDTYYEDIHKVLCQDKTWKWILSRGKVVSRDSGGRALRVIGTYTDLTDYKALQAKYRNTVRMLNLTQEAAHIGSMQYNLKTGSAFWSDETFRLLGIEPGREPVCLSEFSKLIDLIHQDETAKKLDAFLQTIGSFTLTFPVTIAGRTRWLEMKGRVLDDGCNRPQKFIGTLQDISQSMEYQLLLEKNENRFRVLFEKSNTPKILIDAESGAILDANPSACAFYGYTIGEMQQLNVDDINILSRSEIMEKMDIARQHQSESFEFQHRTRTGEIKDVLVNSTAFTLDGRNMFQSIIQDITKRKRLEIMQRDVERIVHHNLRGSLSGTVNISSVIDMAKLDEDDRMFLHLVERSGAKALSTLNATLAMHRIESGTYVMPREAISVQEEVELLRFQFKDLIAAKNINLLFRFNDRPLSPCDRCILYGDSQLIPSIFDNLIKNAIEAAPEGSSVQVALADGNPFTFTTHNPGMVPENMQNCFFEKYATHGKKGGTGIGTYSVRQIALAHGGDVHMETSKAEGTRITVTLPQ